MEIFLDYDGASIEVLKWAEYNPRTDSKKPTWFRLENSIATGPSFFSLDCEQKWLWVVILSLVSQSNGQAITWNSAYIEQMTGIKKDKQSKTIDIFEKFARLRVSRTVTLRDSPATDGRTNVRTDELIARSVSKLPETLRAEIGENLFNLFLARKVTENQWNALLAAYPDRHWVVQEINRAVNWEEANPQRKKKNFAAFITRWLSKGWDTRRIEPTPGPTKGRIWGETEVEKYERELRAEVRMPK